MPLVSPKRSSDRPLRATASRPSVLTRKSPKGDRLLPNDGNHAPLHTSDAADNRVEGPASATFWGEVKAGSLGAAALTLVRLAIVLDPRGA